MTIQVSTLTSCYKMKDYLKNFLESYTQQTFFKRMEIVLDHQEPSKYEIKLIKNFQKKYPGRLKHLISNKVIPLYCSWNRCARLAKGKYLTVWNIDDLRTDNSIQIQYDKLKKSKAGFVYGNYTNVIKFGDKSGNFVDYSRLSKSELTRSMILGPFYMFKKNLWSKLGFFDEQFKIAGDFDFAIRLALSSSGKMINENLGYYLNNKKGLSTRAGRSQSIEKDQVHFRYGIFNKVEKKNFQHLLGFEARQLLFHKKFTPINKFLKQYEKFIKKRIIDRELALRDNFLKKFFKI
jgi:hypothetical protein